MCEITALTPSNLNVKEAPEAKIFNRISLIEPTNLIFANSIFSSPRSQRKPTNFKIFNESLSLFLKFPFILYIRKYPNH